MRAVAAVLLGVLSLSGQTNDELQQLKRDIGALAEARRRDQEIISSLQARLAKLEAANSGERVEVVMQSATVTPPPPAASAATNDSKASDYGVTLPRLDMRFFGDVGYAAGKTAGSPGVNSFGIGQLDMFLTSRINDKFSVLVETVFEHDGNSATVDIERLLLQYRPTSKLRFDIGRFHSAIGYYNSAFHHGKWFQTAASRPFLFRFEDEGGILPLHGVGVSASGRILNFDKLPVSFAVELSNGRSFASGSPGGVQNTLDENRGKALNLSLSARPEAIPGLQVGTSLYRDRLTPFGGTNINEIIHTAHAVYIHNGLELLNEGALLRHSTAASSLGRSREGRTVGFYSQAGYRINRVVPYFRADYANSGRDWVTRPLIGEGGRRALATGMMFDLSQYASLKFQVDRVRPGKRAPSWEYLLQFAFAF